MSRIQKYLSHRGRIMEIDNIINAGAVIKKKAESMSTKRLYSPSERDKESFFEEVKSFRNAIKLEVSTSDANILKEIDKLLTTPLTTIIHCIEIGVLIEKIGKLLKQESKYSKAKTIRLSPSIRLTAIEYILLSSLVLIGIAVFTIYYK